MTSNGRETSDRAGRLAGLFRNVLNGNRKIRSASDAKLFFEAARAQSAPSSCMESIVASKYGVEALQLALRVDLSVPFIQSHTMQFISCLADDKLKVLADGHIFQRLLIAIAKPPTLWNQLISAAQDDVLGEQEFQTFSWLCLELLSLPRSTEVDVLADIDAIAKTGKFINASSPEVRRFGYKIQHILQLQTSPTGKSADGYTPGGRHDNDFADFRDISVYPTTDEFLSTERPFYRRAKEVFETDMSERSAVHLDNIFRLTREDLLGELRSDWQVTQGRRSGKRSALTLQKLTPVLLDLGNDKMRKKCSLSMLCEAGLETIERTEPSSRKKWLLDNRNFLRHQAFGALYQGEEIFGFAFVDRDIDGLIQSPPVVTLQFTDDGSLKRALLALKTAKDDVRFTLVDTPVFAYEPVLERLKDMKELPLQEKLLNPSEAADDFVPTAAIQTITEHLAAQIAGSEISVENGHIRKKFQLDYSQRQSLVNALSMKVSVIQGPPGTGKSFIGALATHFIVKETDLKILVITYTNHAEDQFLEDLLELGINENVMVRLGSKSTAKTASLLLYAQQCGYRRSRDAWEVIDDLKSEAASQIDELNDAFTNYLQARPSFNDIQDHLEFCSEDSRFFEAFEVPSDIEGFRKIGKKGKKVNDDYLYENWRSGYGPGVFKGHALKQHPEVWKIAPPLRKKYIEKWFSAILHEKVERIRELARQYDVVQEQLDGLFNESKAQVLREKRIIGCTTTAAAKYTKLITSAQPDVVIVEEAGEIQESHIITALTPSVKQLILIGDHKQLRPKINNYNLTVERGEGYDLNRSLFERLILQGHPHMTLRKQHRMHPDISVLVKNLTYPDLEDGTGTTTREPLRGLQDRVIFVNHSHPEAQIERIADRRDQGSKSSKENAFEAQMVLKTVRYLAQQGYGTKNMVVLTPYLGQLRLVRDLLIDEVDPWLSDLDSFELIQAGLMTQAAAKVDKSPLRISTIDNYQGEESDIVIVSLTRSNDNGDIGFLAARERLNVLLSRARDCVIMIGNMETGAVLKCGHVCVNRCHRVTDHSKMPCPYKVESVCDRGHNLKRPCQKRNDKCSKCAQEDFEIARKAMRDQRLDAQRKARQKAYMNELMDIQDEIDHQRRMIKEKTEEEEQKKTLAQQRADLAALKDTATRIQNATRPQSKPAMPGSFPGADPLTPPSEADSADTLAGIPEGAKQEWAHMKEFEGAKNQTLDELMGMIGLEDVKSEFLDIKSKVDTALRQGIPLDKERFSCSMLGNPGTGKTTVARLYAKFLTSLGVIPGSCFKEETGASLANAGVSGCKKIIDGILNNGGGVLFIDEAYQLTSGNSYGGGAVLDYLLPEVENLCGRVVFILAGYSKQMESFFAHNPGLPSRFPIEMKFADYTDDELLRIFETKAYKKYKGQMKYEDGPRGLYCRIATRRIGRARGREGFGNARAIENLVAKISSSQAMRLRRERRGGKQPDDFLLTKEDLIGPEPTEALSKSEAWQKLQNLIGLKAVKEAVKSLIDSARQNYQRELEEQPPIEYSLNRVFLGSPGTGKTTVAKLYGSILVDLGLLSKGEVILKNPSDFVGAALGESEKLTKGILAASLGKVLVIDEAYGLYGGHGSNSDPYKTAVIDTIVAEVQSVPGDDQCVLLLGYKEQMENMFQNVNPGLSRRFPVSSAFEFEDFNDDELGKILDMKLKQQGYDATDQAKRVAMEMLNRAKNRPNFGNAGEVDIILGQAKSRHQSRLSKKETRSISTLEALDFDENFDRAERAETNVAKLFEGTVGQEAVISCLQGYQETVRVMKELGLDPKENIPFNFLFRGPPGTGKTTTAKKMGKVFYDMGFLATAEVIECTTSDLIGQYVGQTGPKVQQQLDKALGRVLFIDEAYRLAEGHFAKEAMDELVDAVTKEKYAKKLIIILAGYENDINRLMTMNPGLTSRFPGVVDFRSLKAAECVELLTKLLKSQQRRQKKVALDISALETLDLSSDSVLTQLFSRLSQQDGWANARDIQTVAGDIFKKTIADKEGIAKGRLTVRMATIEEELTKMLQERASRSQNVFSPGRPVADFGSLQTAPPPSANAPRFTTNTAVNHTTHVPEASPPDEEEEQAKTTPAADQVKKPRGQEATRDAGVSDEVWEQLQKDRQAEEQREQEYQDLLKAQRTARAAKKAEIARKLQEQEERRKKEEEAQKKLAAMGACPMGFAWIKQGGGYRCAGGSHFISGDALSRF
ncbi:hypothetical protein VSDG_09328 [Cytospora chrysosperma]|uniref:AAA+ ATPase domain-containing protein n=1 Tax=Cytospora chrysosperma TaxID=252740 RepID=A0A423VCG5_CYTCH|nr:hypothetical protein VSDG_09328 [Valsa sordida]